MLVFGMTVAFSVNVPMFSTLRFFEGFCLAGITLSLYALTKMRIVSNGVQPYIVQTGVDTDGKTQEEVTTFRMKLDISECLSYNDDPDRMCFWSAGIELCLPGWRFSMTMVANFMMLAGQLLMPGLAALCRDWQILQAVIICPLILMLSYIWIFPESLRWLLATQQYSRSKWIMERVAKKNGINLEEDAEELVTEMNRALPKPSKKTCIVKMVGTRNLWKNIVVLCVNSLTGYGIHHCFARSMMDQDVEMTTMFHNFYADYYTMAGIAVASCVALCPARYFVYSYVRTIIHNLKNPTYFTFKHLSREKTKCKCKCKTSYFERSDTLKYNFSVAFSIIGMFSSHAVSNLSIFFCAEITPTVIRGGGLGLVLASAGFGMLTAPIMELHNQKGYFLHHIIFACCTLICIICILLLPETRNQPLPETVADAENYTRQPLLPPRKPGEQRLLLTKSDSREYARVGDTPLHEAAATAISTMDSTASSAIDLHMLIDQQVTGQVELLNMKTLSSSQDQNELKQTIEEYPKAATSAEDPLLASIPNTSTPIAISSIQTSKTESPPDVVLTLLSSSSSVDTPFFSNHVLDSSTSPLSTKIRTPLESPIPGADDCNIQVEAAFASSSPPLVSDSSIHPTVSSPVDDSIPLCAINLSDLPPTSTGQSPNQSLNDIPPSSSIDSPVDLVTDILAPSPTQLSLPPILDPNDQGNGTPAQSFSSPIDFGTPLLHLVASPVMNYIDSGPSSPALLESLGNGTTLHAAVGSTAPHATSTDSVTESGHPLMADLTVSSPIDSGVPRDVDLHITETNTASGETSS
ncbi:Solute carrier family 22 member 23 [Anabarilius grahami]|uniref:Solute carrier family 22 member 23 n=1 Tax=Anabarilius grahami TaxID=495550 RepID=A0A3N0YE55_ANAGA|nr:Solute carrier family 22 member 23 [Anabarilius grahami]